MMELFCENSKQLKNEFSIKDFFSKCEDSLMENFIFCAVKNAQS